MEEKMINCEELANKLYLLLDKELSLKEEENLFEHLEKCSHCFDHYELEKAYLNFIRARCETRHVNSDTISRVKNIISEQIKLEISSGNNS